MAYSNQNDVDLIQQAQSGSVDAFNELVLRYQDYLYSVAYRLLDDRDLAADVTQDAFLNAYQNLNTFRGGGFKAWLARIATNRAYDELRRRKRRREDFIDDLVGGDSDDGAPLASSTPTPEQITQDHEWQVAVQRCIMGLNDDQRTVLVFSDLNGLSYQEIAEALQLELGTVKSRLSRARQAIRRCLQAVQELLPPEYRLSYRED